jgi:hypothetical protein
MRTLNIALFAGLAALVGCADDPEQSLNGVSPANGFIGRTVRVQVSADNASFKDGVSLDFGTGVTVGEVTVASPTAVFAELTIADTAPLGKHDVTVHNGSETLSLKEAFKLESPVAVELQGTLAQGSVVTFTATNLDLTHLYDATCGASFFGICLLYTNLDVQTPAGVTAVVDLVEPFRLSGTLYVDTDAQGGEIKFVSGPATDATKQVSSAMGTETQFMQRGPVTLTAGTPTTTTVAAAFDSHLYSFDAAATSLARMGVSPGDPDASPRVYVLPATGRFTEMVAASAAPNVVSDTASKYFAVYFDGSGLSGYSYAIRVNPLALMALADTEGTNGNNTLANAQPGTAPVLFRNAMFATTSDQDWFRFPVTANDVGKSVHVITAGDPRTDTFVYVYGNTMTNALGNQDDSVHEDFVSAPIESGTTLVHVRITPSTPQYYDPAHNTYVAAVWLE